MTANIDDTAPVIKNLSDFDKSSGSIIERILFNSRPVILILCAITTLFFGFEATRVKLNASFEKMIPTQQTYIVNFLNHYADLQSQGNAIRIIVQADHGTIINAYYLEILKKLNDQVYLLSNVDRPFMTSIWTTGTRWTAVTPDGIGGGPVIDENYDGSAAQLAIVLQHIKDTGQVGSLVSDDFTASTIYVPLLEHDGLTGKEIDYGQLARNLNQIRDDYATKGVTLHIVGFGMVVGDMINAISEILVFFCDFSADRNNDIILVYALRQKYAACRFGITDCGCLADGHYAAAGL